MNFNIETLPPMEEILEQDRKILVDQIKRLALRDTIITFTIIIVTSIVLGFVVYWYTSNIRYAGISVAVFPVLGTLLSLIGVTKTVGFRSAANSISELNNELIGLNPVTSENMKDVDRLRSLHKHVDEYQQKIEQQGRLPVNAELAMYWEFDSSTMAKTARGRDFLNKAKDSVVRQN